MESREGLMADSKTLATKEVELQQITEYEGRTPPTNSESFFHWVKDGDARKTSIRNAKIIPWKGIIALTISVLTTFGSLALLLWLQHKRELVPTTGIYRVMQPASWVSALMSINAAALHIGLLEGVTVAWWFRATRPTANLEQLHDLWATGTSSFSAAAHLQKLSYVSLAALFVAVLPLNSFLLQAAITTPITMVQTYANISVPSVRSFPYGYSAYWSDTNTTWGAIDTVSSPGNWPMTFQQVKNIAGSKYAGYAYIGAFDQCDVGSTNCTDTYAANLTMPSSDHLLAKRYYHNDTLSTFRYRMEGVGFSVDCENSTIPYNLTADENEPTKSGTIFYTDVEWDHDNPNVITLEMSWKPDSSCVGAYEHRFCTLTAATVEYPVEMTLDVSKVYRGPYFSLPVNSSRYDDKVVKILPVYDGDSQTPKNDSYSGVTTFGGIALKFSDWYTSNITYTFPADGAWRSYTYGAVADSVDPGFWATGDSAEACRIEMSWGLSFVNYYEQLTKLDYDPSVEFGPYTYTKIGSPIDLVLNQMRQSMFLASIYQGAGYWVRSFSGNTSDDGMTFGRPETDVDYIQQVNALKTKYVPVYKIRWGLWGASVAMTYSVIGLILPTFWGFWVLKVRPTLSPVDVARAFNAPLTDNDRQNQMHVVALLTEVGKKNIHHDLRPS